MNYWNTVLFGTQQALPNYLLLYFIRRFRLRRMDYKTVLDKFRQRREKILAFLATGKTHDQAAARFGVTRQRIQKIAKDAKND